MKGFMKKFLAVCMVVQMVFSMGGVAWADQMRAPVLALVNGPVFSVTAGKTTKVAVKIRNSSIEAAKTIVVQPTFTDADSMPLGFSFVDNTNRILSLGSRGEKEVVMMVEVEKTAPSKNYPVVLNYTYFDEAGTKYTGNDTIYFKVKNTAAQPKFSFTDLKLSPKSLNIGGTGQLTGRIFNEGYAEIYDAQLSLEELSADGISIGSGLNGKRIAKIGPSSGVDFQFNLLASNDIKAGSHSVTLKLTYKDENGKEYEVKQQYYVNVGGATGGRPALEIKNLTEPKGTYGVNQNFTIQFDLYNLGESEAQNVRVTAAGVGEGGVVPKSTSIKELKSLKAGDNKHFSFTFAGTAAAKSQNYPVEITVEYGTGTPTTFKQYAGVNISNPQAEANGEDGKKSKPKIIVSKYESDPLIVMAGKEFDLKMTLLNTHPQKAVKNIKMFLTLSEETSSDTAKTGNIFTPVNSSNTFYFDSIGSKQTVDKSLRLFVVPDAQPKTYTLTVNFEYEDAAGNEYTATELLGINVKQVTQLDIDEFELPPQAEMGMPMTVSFGYFNTGKVALSNLMIKLEGDIDTPNKNTFIGNLDAGVSDYYEGSFTFTKKGKNKVTVIIAYNDTSGETIEVKREFEVEVTEPMMEEGAEGNTPKDANSLSGKQIINMVIMCAVVLLGIFFVVKKQKNYVGSHFLEAEEEAEEEEQEGMDADEHI